MSVRIDITGQRFGQLVAIRYAYDREWLCQCDCGKRTYVDRRNLKSGNTKSCGCYAKSRRVKHGYAVRGIGEISIYSRWENMIQRCTNPNRSNYKNYGGRGITVDPRWLSFENFLADMGEPPPGLTLDRIDNDLGYSKSNCRWATGSEQMKNRRRK